MMKIEPATFEPEGRKAEAFPVMFNPASLKLTCTNKLQSEEAGGNSKTEAKQATQATTAKMDVELFFDSTDLGVDVHKFTDKLDALILVQKSDKAEAPKTVTFRWGSFSFDGVIESATTTLDFWSAEGTPLRATVALTIVSLHGMPMPAGSKYVTISYVNAPGNGSLATTIATLCGDARAGRALAAANGLESMRMGAGAAAGFSAGAGAMLAVSGGVQLKAAAGFSAGASAGFGAGGSAGVGASLGAGVGFGIGAKAGGSASAGAGFGASAGLGVSASAGIGAGVGVGAGAGFSASAGISAGFGASASAGVSASSGAFAGLGVSKSATLSTRLDPTRLLASGPAAVYGGATARFDITGRLIAGDASGSAVAMAGGTPLTASVRIR
ncbi:hypothetical protein AWB81_05379 [Caballeronia arationis]|uniref:CIS tube protein n=1 Tax=Caballeronia arationis TaxID=1777142 RepID=UPI00074C15E6|nr:hypothetical protein [Caballeronia arationis]SAK96338.1 hypothetical protein AWB81_05379 [Caballeronia arationis]